MLGWIVVIGAFVWMWRQPWRALPLAILAGYFGLSAAMFISVGVFSIWVILSSAIAGYYGYKTWQMKQNGAPW